MIKLFIESAFLFISILSFSCKHEKRLGNRVINVYCDNFPNLTIDTLTTDTIGFVQYIKEIDNEIENYDSLIVNINCPNNIVLPNIISTYRITKTNLLLSEKYKSKNKINNNCISDLPNFLFNQNLKYDIILKIDENGIIYLDNGNKIELETICTNFKNKNITIKLIANPSLKTEKFVKIFDRLSKEKFKVLLQK